ncbi:hypothetical protein BC834DRAFT_997638 [Gloeopeniophorella convolvens]|nr:hypothetical protein BC834DRAFT_997638 [Gloeopeniophorella convolvens]
MSKEHSGSRPDYITSLALSRIHVEHHNHLNTHPRHAPPTRPKPSVIPDLRFEPTYLAKIATAPPGWQSVLWITTRDQVISPLLQGALWGTASVLLQPLARSLAGWWKERRTLRPGAEGGGAGWLRQWGHSLFAGPVSRAGSAAGIRIQELCVKHVWLTISARRRLDEPRWMRGFRHACQPIPDRVLLLRSRATRATLIVIQDDVGPAATEKPGSIPYCFTTVAPFKISLQGATPENFPLMSIGGRANLVITRTRWLPCTGSAHLEVSWPILRPSYAWKLLATQPMWEVAQIYITAAWHKSPALADSRRKASGTSDAMALCVPREAWVEDSPQRLNPTGIKFPRVFIRREPPKQLMVKIPKRQASQSHPVQQKGSESDSGTGDEKQGSPQPQSAKLKVTVVRADGLPRRGFTICKQRFFVSVTDGGTKKNTTVVSSKQRAVQWDAVLGEFTIKPSPGLTLYVFEKRRLHKDGLVGQVEISFDSLLPSSPHDLDLVVGPKDGGAPGPSKQRPTIRLTVTPLESHPSTSTEAVNAAGPRDVGVKPTERADQPEPLDAVRAETEAVADRLRGADEAVGDMSHPLEPLSKAMEYLGDAPDAVERVSSLYETWSGAVEKMKWIVDTVDVISEVHPYAKIAWSVLSFIPKLFLAQVERDANIEALLRAIHDAFDLTSVASALKTLKPGTKQTQILGEMLKHVSDCGDFIKTYAANVKFCALPRLGLSLHFVLNGNSRFQGSVF